MAAGQNQSIAVNPGLKPAQVPTDPAEQLRGDGGISFGLVTFHAMNGQWHAVMIGENAGGGAGDRRACDDDFGQTGDCGNG